MRREGERRGGREESRRGEGWKIFAIIILKWFCFPTSRGSNSTPYEQTLWAYPYVGPLTTYHHIATYLKLGRFLKSDISWNSAKKVHHIVVDNFDNLFKKIN